MAQPPEPVPWSFASPWQGSAVSLRVPALPVAPDAPDAPNAADAADAPRDAVAAALALAACEPLLALLEAWLGVALDPAPVVLQTAIDAAAPPALVEAELPDATLGPPGTRICLPWPLLARRPAPPEALVALRWADLRFEVELAAFAQSPWPADASRAAQGGALLLPPSFEPGWPLRLFDRRRGLQWRAGWAGPPDALTVAAPPEPGAADRSRWRVLLDAPLRVGLATALGWPAAARAAGPAFATLPLRSTAACLMAPGIAVAVARGAVLPMLHGAGLVWGDLASAAVTPGADAAERDDTGTRSALETRWT